MTFKDADPDEVEATCEELFARPEFGDMSEEVKPQFKTLLEELPEDLDTLTQADMDALIAAPRFARLKDYIDLQQRMEFEQPKEVPHTYLPHGHEVRLTRREVAEQPWERYRGDRIRGPSVKQKILGRGQHFKGKR